MAPKYTELGSTGQEEGNKEYLDQLLSDTEAVQRIEKGLDIELPESDQGWLLREAVRLGKYDLAQAVAEKYPGQINSASPGYPNAADMALELPKQKAKKC